MNCLTIGLIPRWWQNNMRYVMQDNEENRGVWHYAISSHSTLFPNHDWHSCVIFMVEEFTVILLYAYLQGSEVHDGRLIRNMWKTHDEFQIRENLRKSYLYQFWTKNITGIPRKFVFMICKCEEGNTSMPKKKGGGHLTWGKIAGFFFPGGGTGGPSWWKFG